MGITQYQYWLLQVSIFGKFPKMPYKLLKVLANTLAIIEILSISLIGYGNKYYLVAIWEISTISPYFWLFGSKSNGIFQNFIIFIIKSLVDHALYNIVSHVWSNTIFILFPHWFGTLAVNARAIIEILIISHQLSAVWFILSNQVYKI